MDEDDMGLTEDEIEEVSDNDEDYEHLKTKKRCGSLSSRQLVERIESDPDHETFRQYPHSGPLLYAFVAFFVIFLAIIFVLLLFGGSNPPGSPEVAISGVMILSLYAACYFGLVGIEHYSDRAVMNSEGIGERGEYGNTAIEWAHIEYVDIWWKGERASKIEFTGNRRSFWVRNSPLGRKFGLNELVRYIPDINNWARVRREIWRKGVVRYVRPRNPDETG